MNMQCTSCMAQHAEIDEHKPIGTVNDPCFGEAVLQLHSLTLINGVMTNCIAAWNKNTTISVYYLALKHQLAIAMLYALSIQLHATQHTWLVSRLMGYNGVEHDLLVPCTMCACKH